MNYTELGSMLHALLFAYEKVFINFYGRDEARKLFSYIIEELAPILYNERDLIIDKSLSLEENMKRFEYFLSNDQFIKGLKINKKNDNVFIIDAEECAFARGGIHETLKMEGGSCPYALLLAAVLTSVLEPDKYIKVGNSEYTEFGSKTEIIIE
jgi:hypothetical protein